MKREHDPVNLESSIVRLERKEYGRSSVALPLEFINPFFEGQIRKSYNQESIEELADSLLEDDMMNPLTVARLSLDNTIEYVDGINETWGTNYSVEDLQPDLDGKYHILIAGHRRLKAVYHNVEQGVYDPEDITVHCGIRESIGLTAALKLQYMENAQQEGVEPSRDAMGINMYFKRRTKEYEEANLGRFTYAQCARELSIKGKNGSRKVKEAEAYFSLPPKVREMVDNGMYDYHRVVKLTGLHDAYIEHRPQYNEEDRTKVLAAALIWGQRDNMSAKAFEVFLKNTTDDLIYQQEALLLSEEIDNITPLQQANRAVEALILGLNDNAERALGHLALGHVDDFREHPAVKNRIDEVAEELGSFIAKLSIHSENAAA